MPAIVETLSCCGLPMSILSLATAILNIVIYVVEVRSEYYEERGQFYTTAASVIIYLIFFMFSCHFLYATSENDSILYVMMYILFGTVIVVFNFIDGLRNHTIHTVVSVIFLICGIINMSMLIVMCGMVKHQRKNRPVVEEQPYIPEIQPEYNPEYNPGQAVESNDDKPPLYSMLFEKESTETREGRGEGL